MILGQPDFSGTLDCVQWSMIVWEMEFIVSSLKSYRAKMPKPMKS